MDIRQVDLNLLKVFDALLKKRHVTQAGVSIGLSQPAMSYALSKLRELFGDPLFVRTGRGMEPTPRAQALGDPVARLLDLVQTEILPAPEFRPAESSRNFVLCMSDIGEMVFLPRLQSFLARTAPHVSIKTVALSMPELEEGLASGEVDLAIGYFPGLKSEALKRKALYRHSYVCIARDDHPEIGDTLSLDQYRNAAHVIVHPEGREQDVLERAHERLGIRINVRFSVPRFIGVPFIVAGSDMIAAVPQAVGRRFAEFVNVKLLPLPFPAPKYDLYLYWHPRFHHEPANRWARNAMSELIKGPMQHEPLPNTKRMHLSAGL
ncbi:LysR family transcriptional regulator [Paraburkholderia sp. Ac-20336]|uniref:LysR family transcriptional regulator n=1 Tax=Burkholderiaceae TaxID=119060 RepID=UPI00141E8CE6|nr:MULTISPECIES: LysR family transcriptional regulator [Burkholderiaceae]MBN3801466.1 LysR family transcriptional regulator [Paraburkholderia sp. Ac-20336]MBN3846017.1 LysR family transcriptional regulator [Paraburkholderia sp. Ac-20342]NIF54159.1 LysR family transcriptional regulator [Burkholderia sp. Ax-1724]NIF77731.1 LysR family transcriptional regulator [Paraburkholderia sp. Cy-641]